jgi:ArsR family transcriptional regulator, lead/cadmium/zinc/bismuth-responsive transcriptional repressor
MVNCYTYINMDSESQCKIYCYDEKKVNKLVALLNMEDVENSLNLLKVLADEIRAKIIFCLSQEKELCVCDVANITGLSIAAASHHLRLLRTLGVLQSRKEGKLVFYYLENASVGRLAELFFSKTVTLEA